MSSAVESLAGASRMEAPELRPRNYDAGKDFNNSVKRAPCIEGSKDDKDKTDWSLLDFDFLTDMADVLTFGAKKYARNNWRKVEFARDRYFAAAMRHLAAWKTGEAFDEESNYSHLAHAAVNLMFLRWVECEKS